MVPGRGLEPPRPYERQHLKLVRLPIPPSGPDPDFSGVVCRAARLRRSFRLVNQARGGQGSFCASWCDAAADEGL